MSLIRRIRKLLNPPRRFYRCSAVYEYFGEFRNLELSGCGRVVTRRWLGQEDLHMPFLSGNPCGEWRAISAVSASAQRFRLGAK